MNGGRSRGSGLTDSDGGMVTGARQQARRLGRRQQAHQCHHYSGNALQAHSQPLGRDNPCKAAQIAQYFLVMLLAKQSCGVMHTGWKDTRRGEYSSCAVIHL